MRIIGHVPQINWPVWESNSTVSWGFDGKNFSIVLNKPPLSVADLPTHSLIAIVGSYDEFGSANLLLYAYDGMLKQTLTAPELGLDAHFGRVLENGGKISAVVGFSGKTGWAEMEGRLNLVSGTLGHLHRAY